MRSIISFSAILSTLSIITISTNRWFVHQCEGSWIVPTSTRLKRNRYKNIVSFPRGPFVSNQSFLPSLSSSLSNQRLLLSQRRMYSAPAAERNRDPIWNVLSQYVLPGSTSPSLPPPLQSSGVVDNNDPINVLEIAAGSGTHTQYFCQKLIENNNKGHSFCWYSSDPDIESILSIQMYVNELNETIVRNKQNPSTTAAAAAAAYSVTIPQPIQLTLHKDGIMESEIQKLLQDVYFDCIVNINMIHISPWEATIGLMKVAGEKLKAKSGILFLYGPYKVNGTCVESNLHFDQSLQSRNPTWGVRDIERVIEIAEANDLEYVTKIEMPANNLSVIFRKR